MDLPTARIWHVQEVRRGQGGNELVKEVNVCVRLILQHLVNYL